MANQATGLAGLLSAPGFRYSDQFKLDAASRQGNDQDNSSAVVEGEIGHQMTLLQQLADHPPVVELEASQFYLPTFLTRRRPP